MSKKNKLARRKVSLADLFLSGELRNYIIMKDGSLMTWEDWYKKPHPLVNKTEDAVFEVVEPKLLDTKQKQLPKN